MLTYDTSFYGAQMERSRESANIVVPYIVDALAPKSMVDIGCGVGYWPLAFQAQGVKIAHGVDGPWVRSGGLQLPEGSFFEYDFQRAKPPFRPALPRDRYDLVTSFEFVEHVEEEFAEPLVDLFCGLSDVIVVGAAIPNQGGLHHVNEQWPRYWVEKFERRGFEACDFIRPQVWGEDIDPWYAQNPIAYFKGGVPSQIKDAAQSAWSEAASLILPLVHPGQWTLQNMNSVPRGEPWRQRLTPRRVARRLGRAVGSLVGSKD
jgi:hypothetical protein